MKTCVCVEEKISVIIPIYLRSVILEIRTNVLYKTYTHLSNDRN